VNYEYNGEVISLENLTRLYGAVVIDMQGEVAEMSLEWYELYGDKVKLLNYVLVFDYTPPGENVRDKKVLEFATQDELIDTMQEVAQFFQK
jgi:type IV secretory pathway TraG/TraD family ATPase VirD4